MTEQATTAAPARAEPHERPANSIARLFGFQSVQILLVLIVLFVVFSILSPTKFPTFGNLRQLAQNASILAVIAVGETFVIITSGIDLSVGSVLVFSGVVSAEVMDAAGGQGWGVAILGIAVAILSGVVWGFVNGFLIAKGKIPPLIVTLGTLGAALGLAEIITGGIDLHDVPDVLSNSVGFGNVFGSVPLISVIALVVAVVGGLVLWRTRFGLHTYAIGSNEEAARRVAVRVDRHLIVVYVIAGASSGFAGLLSLAQFSSTAIAGQGTTNLNVIAAVVIGGTSLFGGYGSIFGTIVGLFIPAVLQSGFVIVGVQPFWQQVAVGAVLIAAVYVDQTRRAAAARGARGRPSLASLITRKTPTTSSKGAPR